MNGETERLDCLISMLCAERGEQAPALSAAEKKRYFRALVNLRMPKEAGADFLKLQTNIYRRNCAARGLPISATLSRLPPTYTFGKAISPR